MNNIDSYKLFLEKLGIREYLSGMADDILLNLKKNINQKTGNSYYEYNGEFNGKPIKVDCYYIKSSAYSTRIGTANAHMEIEKPQSGFCEFKIVTSDLNKSLIIHELKHLDYYVSRQSEPKMLKVPRSGSDKLLKAVNMATYKFPFLIKSAPTLLSILYYSDKNEFESFFSAIYYELKEMISGIISREDKRKKIFDFLNIHPCYIVLEFLHKKKFDIKKCFRNNRDMNLYLNYVNDILDSVDKDDDYQFKVGDAAITRFKSLS